MTECSVNDGNACLEEISIEISGLSKTEYS